MPLISVIIPIYNVEKYLPKCIDGVLQQDFKDIEIILVNDGSPDNCPAICDEYATQDERIKVIHKKNGGLSDARNAGIKIATGQYLMFLDSDDYWSGENCLQNIVVRLKDYQPDVLLHGCMDYYVNNNQLKVSRSNYNINLIRNSSKEQILKYYFESGQFPGSAWINVVKREFVLNNNLFFIKGIKAEDIDWLLNVYLTAQKFDAVDDTFYIYLKHRTDSITGTADIKSCDDVFFTIRKWIDTLQDPKYNYIKPHVLSHLAYQLMTLYISLNNIPKEQRKIKEKELKTYSYLLAYGKLKKIKLTYWLNKICGVLVTSYLLYLFYKIKKS